MSNDRIGFVGLGNMGLPIARRLLDAGLKLVVHDLNPKAVAEAQSRGAEVAGSAREVADQVSLVFISLPTPEAVNAVTLGSNGLIGGKAVRTVVDLSTTGPKVEMAVGEALAARSITLVDCPVSGGVAGARKGTLALMAACPRPLFDEIDPLLAHFGKRFYVGDQPGLAQAMKLINNIVSATALAVTSEAMVLGVKAGLDPDTIIEVMNAGSARNSATVDKIPNFVLTRGFDFGFSAGLSAKDIRLCLELGEQQGVPMILGNALRLLMGITRQRFGDDTDMTSVCRTVEEWAGVEVRGRAAAS
jgi:2-hydroxy-3-oxopropionate reductase